MSVEAHNPRRPRIVSHLGGGSVGDSEVVMRNV